MSTKKKNPSLTLTARDLVDLTSSVIPHAAGPSGWETQILQSVLIRQSGEFVTAIASDRYKIGFQRVMLGAAVSADPGFRAAIPASVLKRIRTVFRATKVHNPTLRLTVDAEADHLVVEVVDGFDTEAGSVTGASLRFATARADDYPKVDRLVRDALTATPTDKPVPMNVNPAFLSDFRTGHPVNTPLRITNTGDVNKPWLVRVGDDFIGLIVPARFAGEASDSIDWLPLLNPVEQKAS